MEMLDDESDSFAEDADSEGLSAYHASRGPVMRILARDEVIDSWDCLIETGSRRGEEILGYTEQCLARSEMPNVNLACYNVAPGLMRGLFGGQRKFHVIYNTSNWNLRPFKMYINARDYGANLQVSWYLVRQPSLWQRLVTKLLHVPFVNLFVLPLYLVGHLTHARKVGILGLDVFDEQDLRAFVTTAHHCVLEAADKLMLDLGQDRTNIKRQSRGFLGIS